MNTHILTEVPRGVNLSHTGSSQEVRPAIQGLRSNPDTVYATREGVEQVQDRYEIDLPAKVIRQTQMTPGDKVIVLCNNPGIFTVE